MLTRQLAQFLIKKPGIHPQSALYSVWPRTSHPSAEFLSFRICEVWDYEETGIELDDLWGLKASWPASTLKHWTNSSLNKQRGRPQGTSGRGTRLVLYTGKRRHATPWPKVTPVMSQWGLGRKLRSPDLRSRALSPFAEQRRVAWRSLSRRRKDCVRARVARGAEEALPFQIESRHRCLSLRSLIRHTSRTLQKPLHFWPSRRVRDRHRSANSRPYPAPWLAGQSPPRVLERLLFSPPLRAGEAYVTHQASPARPSRLPLLHLLQSLVSSRPNNHARVRLAGKQHAAAAFYDVGVESLWKLSDFLHEVGRKAAQCSVRSTKTIPTSSRLAAGECRSVGQESVAESLADRLEGALSFQTFSQLPGPETLATFRCCTGSRIWAELKLCWVCSPGFWTWHLPWSIVWP